MDLSESEISLIAGRYFPGKIFQIENYYYKDSDAARGFLSCNRTLCIETKTNGKFVKSQFFVKLSPTSRYHVEFEEITKVFFKETQFFKIFVPLLTKFMRNKVFPDYYFSNDRLIVFEDIGAAGYRNEDSCILSVDQCKAALKSLAAYHSASFLSENEIGTSFDESNNNVIFVNWYAESGDHPGNKHMQTSIKALTAVFNTYFDVEESMREKAIDVFRSIPKNFRPSKAHRNALSHSDLWSNNIMFKSEADQLNACLIDQQIFAYNPPALDVCTLLSLNASNYSVKTEIPNLLKYYYSCFSDNISAFRQNPDYFMSYDDFKKSVADLAPVALGCAILTTQFTTLPEEILSKIVTDEEKLVKLMEQDRTEVVCESIDNFPAYKTRLFSAINNLIDYLKGDFVFI